MSSLVYPITLHGRWGTTGDFPSCPVLAAPVELEKSIPVHSLILSSHLFFCLPLLLFPFTVPCRIVFAEPVDLETWPNHLSFCFLSMDRSSSYSPMAAWIFLQTSSLIHGHCTKCSITFGSISFQRPAFSSLALLSRSMIHRLTEICK